MKSLNNLLRTQILQVASVEFFSFKKFNVWNAFLDKYTYERIWGLYSINGDEWINVETFFWSFRKTDWQYNHSGVIFIDYAG